MKNFDLLKALYEIHSPSGNEKKMRKFVKRIAAARGGVVVQENGNIYVTKGEAETYPCICAHLDQVQEAHSKDFTVYKQGDIIFAYSAKSKAQQGLGADDKNGIWIALELLEQLDVLKCAFFSGEEIGCVGSSKADMTFFEDVRYCIEPDRRNGHDLITDISGAICSDDFIAAINYERFGYKQTTGLMTDVQELCEKGVGVSCINFSCGYYNPHTDEECASWSELCNALDFAHHICTTLEDTYPHTFENKWDAYGKAGYFGGYNKGSYYGGANYTNYGHGYGGNYGDWYDDWYEKRYGKKSGESDFEDDYSNFDRDDDYETMYAILDGEPHLTFDEVIKNYGELFISQNANTLKQLYNEAISYVRSKYFNNPNPQQEVKTDEENKDAKQLEFGFAECL